MSRRYRWLFAAIVLIGASILAIRYFQTANIAVLNPKGPVAGKERNLIVFVLLMSLLVVVPVYAMTIGIAWRYRAGNTKAKYSPNLDHNAAAETAWWLIPTALIVVFSIVTWRSSHTLDPARPLVSANKQMTIQAIAMEWKWLFIYPQQNIASVNYVKIPINTPVDFEITSDAPMNSFWIPQLGGQIYAMAGMSTHMHLEATSAGDYAGSSANISGQGFAGMTFTASAGTQADFRTWVRTVKTTDNPLITDTYNHLAKPSENNPPSYYSSAEPDLFGNVLARFMVPGMEDYVR